VCRLLLLTEGVGGRGGAMGASHAEGVQLQRRRRTSAPAPPCCVLGLLHPAVAAARRRRAGRSWLSGRLLLSSCGSAAGGGLTPRRRPRASALRGAEPFPPDFSPRARTAVIGCLLFSDGACWAVLSCCVAVAEAEAEEAGAVAVAVAGKERRAAPRRRQPAAGVTSWVVPPS